MFVEFLGSQSVTFAYYLFTFFAILAALVICWSQWQRNDSFKARRLTVAFVGLIMLRVIFVLLLVAGANWPQIPEVWTSAFERVVSIGSLGLLVWGFTPFFREKGLAGNTLLVANLAFAIIAYFVAAFSWPGGDFNRSAFELFFMIWQFGLAAFGLINCAAKLDDERTFALFGFITICAGLLMHLYTVFADAYMEPHAPIWVRLAELIAYPLFAVAVYYGAIQLLRTRTRQYQSLTKVSSEKVDDLISLFKTTKEIAASLELSQVLDGAVQSVARALEADQAAIALPDSGDDMSHLRLISIYNPSRKGRGESVTFPISDQQVIKHSVKRKYQVRSDEYKDNPQIRMLFTLMGAHEVGPLIIQPLLKDGEALGVLILGNAISKRTFSDNEAEFAKIIAEQISTAVAHAKEHASVSAKAQQLSWTLRNQELDAGKRLAAMESELRKSREEVGLFAQRLQQYETVQQTKDEQLQQAQQQITKLQKTVDRAKVEVEKTRQKERELVAQSVVSAEVQTKVNQLAAERDKLMVTVEQLQHSAAETERLNEALTAANNRARKLARALKQARTLQQQATPVPAALSSAEASTELEDLTCGVIISDTQQKVNRVNAATTEMLGLSGKQLQGSDLSSIIDDERWRKALKQFDNGQEMVTTTFQVGDSVFRATIGPMSSADGTNKEGTVTIVYDITAEAESQRARDEFIASLSQDLRTPMTSITGYTDLLVGESVGTLGEMQRKFMQRIKANIERMNVMLNDLIGVTAIDAGQLELRPTMVNMAEVIEDTVIGARAQLDENEIKLDMEIPDDIPSVEVDPDSVRQIMNNLLGNAIKSTPMGGSIGIMTKVCEENGAGPVAGEQIPYLMISIRDSGGGIAEKDLERVFERFYRAERALIEGLGETGVGLSIVKSLVEAQGGRIWVESEIGEGSTFRFLLPVSAHYNDDPWLEVDIPPLDL